jgi:hypothetical protein
LGSSLFADHGSKVKKLAEGWGELTDENITTAFVV